MEGPSVDVLPRSFPLYHKVCALCWVSRASPAGRLRPLAYAAMAKQPAKDRLSLPILGLAVVASWIATFMDLLFLWPSLDKSFDMTLGSGAAQHKNLFGGQWNGALITNPLVEERIPPLVTPKKPKSGRVCLECLCGYHAHKFYMPPNLERLDVAPTQKVQNKLYVICMI